MKLQRTADGIYYLHYYIPKKKFSYYSEEDIRISKLIWGYKNGDEDAITEFTIETMNAISTIFRGMNNTNIFLMSVPSSKVMNASSINKTTAIITEWYKQGITRNHFGCTKNIYDWSFLLKRVINIPASHRSYIRTSYETQKETIKCELTNLSFMSGIFVILDDVTTTGTSMNACKDILIEHGVSVENIIRIAIAKTI